MSILLKNMTSEEVFQHLNFLGVNLPLARKIQASALKKNEWLKYGSGVPRNIMEKVYANAVIPNLVQIEKIESSVDQFARYVFQGKGEAYFEAVRIPLLHRSEDLKYIVCVSSQVGCAMGCDFCCTGKMGFIRQLETWEIVDQVIKIAEDSTHPVKGVVFMGMGEPFLNYDNVMRAAQIISEPCGLAISAKAITISTSGVVPGIKRFVAEKQPYRLVISLTTADSKLRRSLMPVEKRWSTHELIEALQEYYSSTHQRITLAWILLSGINTTEKEARDLAVLFKGLPIKLDLIDVNDPTGKYLPPSEEELNFFRDVLRRELKMPFARRYSGGKDISAACGMLASKHNRF